MHICVAEQKSHIPAHICRARTGVGPACFRSLRWHGVCARGGDRGRLGFGSMVLLDVRCVRSTKCAGAIAHTCCSALFAHASARAPSCPTRVRGENMLLHCVLLLARHVMMHAPPAFLWLRVRGTLLARTVPKVHFPALGSCPPPTKKNHPGAAMGWI